MTERYCYFWSFWLAFVVVVGLVFLGCFLLGGTCFRTVVQLFDGIVGIDGVDGVDGLFFFDVGGGTGDIVGVLDINNQLFDFYVAFFDSILLLVDVFRLFRWFC